MSTPTTSSQDKRRRNRIQNMPWNRPKASFAAGNNIGNQNLITIQNKNQTNTYEYIDQTSKKPSEKDVKQQLAPHIEKITETGMYKLWVPVDALRPSQIQYIKGFLPVNIQQTMFDYLFTYLPWEQRKAKSITTGDMYTQQRYTCFYGHPYSYSQMEWEGTWDNWDPKVKLLRDQISQQFGINVNSVLCNLYKDGHNYIPWHSDDEKSLGRYSTIISLSLGSVRDFELCRRDWYQLTHNNCRDPMECVPFMTDDELHKLTQHYSVALGNGDLLIMSGSLQEHWMHRVAKEYHDRGPRINLTFRYVIDTEN